MSDPAIPRRAEQTLSALGADPDFRDAVLGDLAEEFAIRAVWDGVPTARKWYYRESVRVAPHLFLSWSRRVGVAGSARLAAAIAVSYAAIMAFEAFIVRVVAPVLGVPTEGMGVAVTTHSQSGRLVYFSVLVIWTLCDGVVAGYVTARVSRRAPLASALACAAFWGAIMFTGNFILRASAPLSFRVFNTLALAAGVVIGGLIRSSGRRTSIGVV